MTTTCTHIAIFLAAILALGLGSAGRASAEPPAGFSQAELDQMLAPVALYPDSVLSHVLIAATYPLEVVQAARWSRANPGLAGEYAVAAVEHQPWDPSVMALVAFPELLARMDADLAWTQRLGDAFLIQEYQVLDTVQYLRDEAYASGHLRSNEYVRVVRETEYIYIEPSVTRVVYVPWYDPYIVYGGWRWSAYPPIYWQRPHGYLSGFSFHWSNGHRLQHGFFFSAVHWPSHRLVVHGHHDYYRRHGKHGYSGPRFTSGRQLARYEGARHWKHDPDHRRGVAYRRGIDERHTMRPSKDSRTATRSHEYDQGQHDRRDLLRQRSRSSDILSQRAASPAVESSARRRSASDRAIRSRDAIRRDAESVLGVARNKPAASDRGGRVAADRSGGAPRNEASERSASDSASLRRNLAQRKASTGTTLNRANGRRSASNPERSGRAGARPSSRSAQRLSRQTPGQASQKAPSHASLQSSTRSRGKSSRADVLRNRDRRK